MGDAAGGALLLAAAGSERGLSALVGWIAGGGGKTETHCKGSNSGACLVGATVGKPDWSSQTNTPTCISNTTHAGIQSRTLLGLIRILTNFDGSTASSFLPLRPAHEMILILYMYILGVLEKNQHSTKKTSGCEWYECPVF